ncbi:UbiA family prenyltransferase [Methanoculleus sp. MH98A]|uniref:UbiA family prenyltransferase n=1 Tax=Methanoculleus sp. MH98A TaxID=1495314 RepID=UPI00049ECD0B|nr:UbiA family prenyltransferase [Methanoculleus sp. MH98A]KDE55830.1 prenyltransferase [Methanoculleus sp. MH98A]
MRETLAALADLTRAHFFFVWPLLFCSGLALAFANYGGFSWELVGRAALIGLLGFEAGLVLNDYVDREYDRRDVNGSLTRYWRPFGERPIPAGKLSPRAANALFLLLAGLAAALAATLPAPHNLYVLGIMGYSYLAEYFYQAKKRDQKIPIAQIVGRTDFALFPVAGYLVYGNPDTTALLFFLFFYPWTLAHLGANDIADIENDRARGMATIPSLTFGLTGSAPEDPTPVLYGMRSAGAWVLGFSAIHAGMALVFGLALGPIAIAGFAMGLILLGAANYLILSGKSADAAMRALPLMHASLLVYAAAIIAGALL